MTITRRTIKTSHADIAISETSATGLPVLLIHGNSSSKEVFDGMMKGPVGQAVHLIAMDLPGHGASSDAFNPERTYTMPGYAEAAVELLEKMDIKRAAVFGWSLGGHVALEMIPRMDNVAGVMIAGTPPVGKTPAEIQAGFQPIPQAVLAGKREFTDEDIVTFGTALMGQLDGGVREAIERTDGKAREIMFTGLFSGKVSDERKIVEESPVPIAVVNGADDPLVNLDYVSSLKYRNLWDKHCYVLRGAGHASFLQVPETFSAILMRFAADVAKRPALHAASKKSHFAA